MAREQGDAHSAPSHLRRLLLDAGVGSQFTLRQLAKTSGYRLSKDWWARVTAPIPPRGHNVKADALRIAADTLRQLGSPVTFEQLDRAMLADRGHIPAASGDDLSEVLARVQNLSHADQLRLIQEVALLLAPDSPADHSRTSATRTPREG